MANEGFKGTPGPWQLRKTIRDGRQWISGPKWEGFADVVVEVNKKTCNEGKANAKLIAAAPDLLEALQYAVAQYGKPGGPWNVPSDPGGWLERSRAAIAKATGAA